MSAEIENIRVKKIVGNFQDRRGYLTPGINPITVGELRTALATLDESWDSGVLVVGSLPLKSLRLEVTE